MPPNLVMYFDGLCLPKNPGGVATYGFVAKRGAKTVHEEGGLAAPPYTPEATNNVAEYTGVLKALEWARREGLTAEKILVRGDSELVIKQIKGEYKVKSPSIVSLFTQVRDLAREFSAISFEWIPREQNKEADALTNRAYAEFGAIKKNGKRREDASARITRGFKIEIETSATPSVTFKEVKAGPLPAGRVESDSPPSRLAIRHGDDSTTILTLTPLSDGTRILCEHARPPGEKSDAIETAERDWHAALLSIQSRLDE